MNSLYMVCEKILFLVMDSNFPMMIFEVLLRAVVAVVAIIVICRINGLRSFSKMSSYDFALTVASGSIVGAIVMGPGTNTASELVALASVFLVQWSVSWLRQHFPFFKKLIDNTPLLLMHDGVLLHDNLRRSRVTESDVMAKLRESNTFALSEVHAVVLECTGDISVMHAQNSGRTLDHRILADVHKGTLTGG